MATRGPQHPAGLSGVCVTVGCEVMCGMLFETKKKTKNKSGNGDIFVPAECVPLGAE